MSSDRVPITTLSPPKRAGGLRGWLQSFNPYVPEQLEQENPDGMIPIRIEESSIKKSAGRTILIFFSLFLVWAFIAPIDSGVPVNATVVVEGSRKAVQHPNGGVVQEILVTEGSVVKENDVLIRINPLHIEASLRDSEYQYINTLATYSRLVAERRDQNTIIWDKDLEGFGDHPQAQEAKHLETQLFISRRENYLSQRALLAEQAKGLEEQVRENESIVALRQEQMLSLVEETDSLRDLAKEGFVPRSQALNAERSRSDAEAGLIGLRSTIASLHTQLASNRLEIARMQSTYNKEIDTELTTAQRNKETLRAQVSALRFDKSLTDIRAPVSGTVVALKVHTVGGVINGGDMLMELVPKEHALIVQAAVPPHLIDRVKVGLDADIRFTAMNQNSTPLVQGRVRLVGVDRLPPAPPQFPEEYYLVWVETTEQGLIQLGDFQMQAGMPAMVLIKTGERSFMNYIMKPFMERFAMALREN